MLIYVCLMRVTGKALVAGHLDVCLCVSLIPDFIKVNAACQTAVNLIGVAKVTALIEGLVRPCISSSRYLA